MSIERQLQLATRILNLRNELKAAEAELAAFTGRAKPQMRTNTRKPAGKGQVGPSISQRVLNMIVDNGRTGIATRDIVAVIPNKDAVHSALQAHRTAGRIINDAGQWCVSAKYAEELSAPKPVVQVETRPIRPHPAGGEYLGA